MLMPLLTGSSEEARFVFLVSAPSGTGKTTIIRGILKAMPDLRKIVTTTSRRRRTGEQNGLDYHFISKKRFQAKVRNGEFIEWKQHFGNFYGLTWSEFDRAPERDAIFDMDVFGKEEFLSQVRSRVRCTTIFLAPPSIEAIKDRLLGRGRMSESRLTERLARAIEEMQYASAYDSVIVNRGIEQTISEVRKVIDETREARSTQRPRYICIEGLIGSGKTTLAQILAASLNARLYLDPSDRNPFLEDFYLSRRTYALETELNFALLRHRLAARIKQDLTINRTVISDFTMSRSQIFASVNLNEGPLAVFSSVYNELAKDTPSPDIIIWLEAPYGLLMGRIKTRGRTGEIVGVDEDYLRRLRMAYEGFLKEHSSRVVFIEVEGLDLVKSNEVLGSLVARIRASTQGENDDRER